MIFPPNYFKMVEVITSVMYIVLVVVRYGDSSIASMYLLVSCSIGVHGGG